jgi:ferrous iron transport protein A
MTLNNVPHGSSAIVQKIAESGANSLRLMEMGLVPGACVRVVRSAPLGDPLQVKLRDYHLALRRTEAELIDVALDSVVDGL